MIEHMNDKYPDLNLYVDGRWVRGNGESRRAVVNPADDSILGELQYASRNDLDRAIEGAERGFSEWRTVAPAKRADILLTAARILRQRKDEIARLAALEEGQPFEEAKSYVLRAAEIIEWDANEARRLYGRVVPSESGLRMMVLREPIGPVAAFTPWNAPVFTPCRKIGSALGAGCSLIMKGAEETPASTAAVVQCFVEAGLPDGALNLVYGDPGEISSYLIASPTIRLVTFTGSVSVGKRLAEQAARHMKPSVMELGGHAPVIVCEDADAVAAAQKLAYVKYRNAGQACLSPTRFWVHDRVHDAFLDRFVAEVSKIKVGPAFEAGVSMGPVANSRRLAAIEGLVIDAVAHGARVAYGGNRIGNGGCFFEPTVLVDVPDQARIMSEEPFGPVAIINRFNELEPTVSRANGLPYGLAGYVFTRSAATAELLARQLECGTIGINHLTVSTSGIPFGGIKDSGFGREGGIEGIESYTIAKTVSHLM